MPCLMLTQTLFIVFRLNISDTSNNTSHIICEYYSFVKVTADLPYANHRYLHVSTTANVNILRSQGPPHKAAFKYRDMVMADPQGIGRNLRPSK